MRISDWSSVVCSSDLAQFVIPVFLRKQEPRITSIIVCGPGLLLSQEHCRSIKTRQRQVARVTVAQAERDGAPRPPHRPARDRAAAVILRDRLAIDAANRLAPLPPRRRRR